MSNRAELLKSIIKGTSDISEDASLDKYLLSRGINPKFATKDQKVAHSKTGQFIKWKNDHLKDLGESVDKKDTVTLDIPLLIRVLELAREDIKTDMDLHRVVEKLINIRTKGMLTMKDYNYIAKIHEDIMSQVSPEIIEEAMKTPEDEKKWEKVAQTRSEIWRRKQVKKIDEDAEQIDEISKGLVHSYYKKAYAQKYKNEPTAPTKLQRKNRNKGMGRAEKRLVNRLVLPKGVDPSEGGKYTADSVEHDGTPMVEAQSAAIRFQKALQREKAKREEQEKRDAENAKRALTPKPVQESECGCDDVPPEDKNKKLIQMSKSARMIKSIYKKQGMKEETYDHEKEDKSIATYGKKPKISVTNKESSFGEKKPDAAAVLTGGTTLTGQPRDTVEIDPMMRKRPGPDIPGKKN